MFYCAIMSLLITYIVPLFTLNTEIDFCCQLNQSKSDCVHQFSIYLTKFKGRFLCLYGNLFRYHLAHLYRDGANRRRSTKSSTFGKFCRTSTNATAQLIRTLPSTSQRLVNNNIIIYKCDVALIFIHPLEERSVWYGNGYLFFFCRIAVKFYLVMFWV